MLSTVAHKREFGALADEHEFAHGWGVEFLLSVGALRAGPSMCSFSVIHVASLPFVSTTIRYCSAFQAERGRAVGLRLPSVLVRS